MLPTYFLSTLAIASLILSPCTYADDSPATVPEPVTPEAQRLKDVQAEAALAKAKLELAQSELDLLKLKVGTLDTTNLPKGTAAVTDMNLEGTIRAYAAAKKSIDEIAAEVAKNVKAGASIVVATDAQLQSLNQYRSFLAQIEQLKKQTDGVLSATAPSLKDPCAKKSPVMSAAAVSTAFVAINSMLSLASLFKKDIELKGKDVTLNDFAMMTMVLKALQGKSLKPIYPAAYYLLPPGSAAGQPLTKWDELFAYKKKLNDHADTYTAQYETLPDHSSADAVCKKKLASLKAQVDAYLAGLSAAGKAIDDVGATLTKQEAQSGLTLISAYLVSERIEKAIGTAPVLQVKAVAAGGSSQTAKGAFSTKISFSGGSILSYQLFNQDGTLVIADTIPWYAGFIEANEFKPGRVDLQ
jgi:hypothetical protein